MIITIIIPTLAVTALTLYIHHLKIRKDKLEFLYDTVITPASSVFFRKSELFLNQKNLSPTDENKIEELMTTITDYVNLSNNITRCRSSFSKKGNVYMYLSMLRDECDYIIYKNRTMIYDHDKLKALHNVILDPLRNICEKHISRYYNTFDKPRL